VFGHVYSCVRKLHGGVSIQTTYSSTEVWYCVLAEVECIGIVVAVCIAAIASGIASVVVALIAAAIAATTTVVRWHRRRVVVVAVVVVLVVVRGGRWGGGSLQERTAFRSFDRITSMYSGQCKHIILIVVLGE